MNLEDVTAEIRPRSGWEAVDLGLSLVRRHFLEVVKGWLGTVLPICVIFFLVFYQSLGWALFLMWWCKPVFERVVLFDLSRHLFGVTPTVAGRWQALRTGFTQSGVVTWIGLVLAVVGAWLSQSERSEASTVVTFWMIAAFFMLLRCIGYRTFELPVKALEGLKGGAMSRRVRVLANRFGSTASSLAMLCFLTEIGLVFSLVEFLDQMNPRETNDSIIGDWSVLLGEMLTGRDGIFPIYLKILLVVIYFLAVSVSTLLFVGGGFGLYVNSRTWVEGWDIELAFRRLAKRLSLITVALLAFGFQSVEAQGDFKRERLEQVLAHEDFDLQTRTDKYWVSEEKDNKRSFFEMGGLMEVVGFLFWCLVTTIVVFLIYQLVRHRHLFGRRANKRESKREVTVRAVAGLDVTPESLPSDIPEAARERWRRGDRRGALALLYRGALSRLVVRDLVPISESDTEQDCLLKVETSQRGRAFFEGLNHLTQHWVTAAYASRFPDEQTFEAICRGWTFDQAGERRPQS